MQCKLCGTRLEPDMELCPQCGMRINREEPPAEEVLPVQAELPEQQEQILEEETASDALSADVEEQVKPTKNGRGWKTAVAVVAVAAVLCVLLFVVFQAVQKDPQPTEPTVPVGTVPADGNPDDATCQGSYTDTDAALKNNADTVVATLGDMSLTNGQLQVLYSMIQYSFIGNSSTSSLEAVNLNLEMPLDQQRCGLDETLTWQQYFLQMALEEWKLYAVLCQAADSAGFKLSDTAQQELDAIYDQFYETYVKTEKFATVDEMLQHDIGPGCTFQDYKAYREWNAKTMAYYSHLYESQEVTDADIEAYFKEFEETLSGYGIKKDGTCVVDVRHILITIETAAGEKKEYTDADWETCRGEAQKILDKWLAGDATEDTFAQLANEHSEDPGSNKKGGLYTNVSKGDMLESFDSWCFDENHKAGDYGLVKTKHGYHIMYLSATEEVWYRYCREEAAAKKLSEYVAGLNEEAQMKVNYHEIGLWDGLAEG